jgi:hypothetical protein
MRFRRRRWLSGVQALEPEASVGCVQRSEIRFLGALGETDFRSVGRAMGLEKAAGKAFGASLTACS